MSDIETPNLPENLPDFLLPPSSISKPPPEPHKDFAKLREALAISLMPNDNGEEMLRRQMQVLEAIFDTTIAAYAGSASSPLSHAQESRLAFALRLQSQCLSTARTLSTMDYMGALKKNISPPACGHGDFKSPRACAHDDLNTPHPPSIDEQKEDGA